MKNKLIVLGSLIVLFIINTILMLTGNYEFIDQSIITFIEKVSNPILDTMFKIITVLGDYYFIVLLILIAIIILKRKSIYIILVSLFSVSMMGITKFIIKRPRPIEKIIEISGYSYVSGHSSISLAFYGFIVYLITKSNLSFQLKFLGNITLILLIVLIGLSRMYLRVHYLSDVIGGYIIGAIALIITIIIYQKKRN